MKIPKLGEPENKEIIERLQTKHMERWKYKHRAKTEENIDSKRKGSNELKSKEQVLKARRITEKRKQWLRKKSKKSQKKPRRAK